MLTFVYYILKVFICSGILYGYYLIALRNKIFHRWNRFYLLAAIVLSLAVPLIKINVWQNAEKPTTVMQLLQAVSTGDEFVFEYTKNKGSFDIDVTKLSVYIYIVVSLFLSGFLIQTLLKINRLKKNNKQTIIEGVNFINTNAKGTPFSFFNNIFWNDEIDINSSTGKQIFQHEVAHVQEKHSYDKVFINVVLIFFWCNPFFWFIRKELNIIHEFIADKKALEDSDTAAFAAMILQATYPQQQFNITNNFFYSPLKRRLIMLTKNKNLKISYTSRVLVLPLAALVFFAFTLKMKPIKSANYNAQQQSNQNIIQDTAVENFNSKDAIKAYLQKRISEISENNAKKDFLIKKLSELNENSFERDTIDSTYKIYKDFYQKVKQNDSTYKIYKDFYQKVKQNDSIPQFYKGKKIKEAYGSEKLNKALIVYEDGRTDTIEINEAEKIKLIPPPPPAMIFKNLKINKDFNTNDSKAHPLPDKVFTKVEVEPSFPGDEQAWTRYIKKIIESHLDELVKNNKSGTCRVRFIVDTEGNVSDIKVLSMQGTKLAEIALDAIQKGPRWIPAMQNDHKVTAYREQPITFTIREN